MQHYGIFYTDLRTGERIHYMRVGYSEVAARVELGLLKTEQVKLRRSFGSLENIVKQCSVLSAVHIGKNWRIRKLNLRPV